MKTEYNGIEITYIEGTNDWHFVLRGRARKADSLAKAKEAIEKEPAERRKPFPRFDAYMLNYGGVVTVTVTSIAEDHYHRGTSFWITRGDDRRKEKDIHLYAINDHNKSIFGQIAEKEKAGRVLEEQIAALKSQLENIKAPEGL